MKNLIIISIVLAVCITGLIVYKTNNQSNTASSTTQTTENNKKYHKAKITVLISEIVTQRPLDIKPADKFNIIIRNRPHGALEVSNIQCQDLPLSNTYVPHVGIVNTKTQLPIQYRECLITVIDNKIIEAPQAYISNGNQLKTGLQLRLENKLYALFGKIVNIELF